MATVPNLYYQSPHIEAAARSLASALAPPDPEKLLSRERSRFEFDRMQKLATIQDQQRLDKEESETAFASMLTPVLREDGTVDEEATNRNIMAKWALGVEKGGDPAIGAKLAGTLNPQFAASQALAETRGAQAAAAIAQRGDIQEGIQQLILSGRKALQDDQQEFTAAENEKKRRHESEQNFLKQQARVREISAREAAKKATGGASTWRPIPDAALREITYGLDDIIRATNRTMTLQKRNQFVDRAIRRWQKNGGNPTNALNETWASAFPDATSYEDAAHDPDVEGGFWSGYKTTRGALNPVFNDEEEDTYGSVLTDPNIATMTPPPPAYTPPAAAPAPRPPKVGKPKEGDRQPSKSGAPMIYRNGRWEYE